MQLDKPINPPQSAPNWIMAIMSVLMLALLAFNTYWLVVLENRSYKSQNQICTLSHQVFSNYVKECINETRQ